MIVIKDKDIPFSLQLVKSDSTFEEQATVSYTIKDSSGSNVVSSKSALWDNTLKTYFDELDISADWSTQSSGNYLLVWSVTNVVGFPSTIIEDFEVMADFGMLEGSTTFEEMFRVMFSALAGKTNGSNTTAPNFRDIADSKNRIDATVDRYGNRTAISFDGSE